MINVIGPIWHFGCRRFSSHDVFCPKSHPQSLLSLPWSFWSHWAHVESIVKVLLNNDCLVGLIDDISYKKKTSFFGNRLRTALSRNHSFRPKYTHCENSFRQTCQILTALLGLSHKKWIEMRWDSESQLIIWSCYYGSHLRLQIPSRPILCGILNQCWSWPCQILSHDICRSSFQLDIWIFLWCLDISLHPDVRDNLHTKRFGFTTGNRQLQLEIDYRLEFDYQQSICLFWKVLGWFEKCPDDLKSVRMIYKMCLDCLENVQMIC